MSRSRVLDLGFLALFALTLLVFVPRLAGGGDREVADGPGAVLAFAALTKLALLAIAAYAAVFNSRRFPAGSPGHRPWRLLAAGLASYALGQAVLVLYQLVLDVPVPFPSPADLFFVLAMVLLVAALTGFVVNFRRGGFLPGDGKRLAWMAGVLAVALAAAGVLVLAPVVTTGEAGVELWLNLIYPLSDLVLLVPALLLLAASWRLQGGSVARVWIALLLGFLVMAGADVLFAYLTTLGRDDLDPVIDILFILSYVLLARGMLYQSEVLTTTKA